MEDIHTKGTVPIEDDREITENLIASLQKKVDELEKERDHWKNTCASALSKNILYESEITKLKDENERLKRAFARRVEECNTLRSCPGLGHTAPKPSLLEVAMYLSDKPVYMDEPDWMPNIHGVVKYSQLLIQAVHEAEGREK